MKEPARCLRLPPCPPYDVESTESWLSDMAAQGWKLEPDDFFFGIASFIKTDPAPVRYRLGASPQKGKGRGGGCVPQALPQPLQLLDVCPVSLLRQGIGALPPFHGDLPEEAHLLALVQDGVQGTGAQLHPAPGQGLHIGADLDPAPGSGLKGHQGIEHGLGHELQGFSRHILPPPISFINIVIRYYKVYRFNCQQDNDGKMPTDKGCISVDFGPIGTYNIE